MKTKQFGIKKFSKNFLKNFQKILDKCPLTPPKSNQKLSPKAKPSLAYSPSPFPCARAHPFQLNPPPLDPLRKDSTLPPPEAQNINNLFSKCEAQPSKYISFNMQESHK